jgi:hypothetical protein
MISSNIFHFSLLSISWISFVRPYLTAEQDNELRGLWANRDNNLRGAFNAVTPSTLDAYYQGWIRTFDNTICLYLRKLDVNVRDGQIQAPEPHEAVRTTLAGIPNLVYMIRYSNITILKDLKDLISVHRVQLGPRSILGMINDIYVTSVWDDYAIYLTELEPGQLETYIVYLIVLFSMNKTLLNNINPYFSLDANLVNRLESYQTMITSLHSAIAAYMQIVTLIPYYRKFEDIENELNQLARDTSATNPDMTLQLEIKTRVHNLSTSILQMIAIYGRPPKQETTFTPAEPRKPGTEIISKLIGSQWEIRRLVGQVVCMGIPEPSWLLEVVMSFQAVLPNIAEPVGPWSRWMLKIGPILRLARSLLKSAGARGRTRTSGTRLNNT